MNLSRLFHLTQKYRQIFPYPFQYESGELLFCGYQLITFNSNFKFLSFLRQKAHESCKAHRDVSHQLGNAFGFVGEFLAASSPYDKQCMYDSLDCVEISGRSHVFAFYFVLLQIAVKSPVHTFY